MFPETQIAVELHELHEYARQELAVYVAWFTFFITTLFASMAWSLKTAVSDAGKVTRPVPFFCAVVLFSIQLVFSIYATAGIEADFNAADRRGSQIQQLLPIEHELRPPHQSAEYVPMSPFPQSIHRAIDLMYWTLWTNLVFWLAFASYVWTRKNRLLFHNFKE